MEATAEKKKTNWVKPLDFACRTTIKANMMQLAVLQAKSRGLTQFVFFFSAVAFISDDPSCFVSSI